MEEREDGLVIQGRYPSPGGTVDAAGDHRIAMAAAVAAVACEAPVTITGAQAVDKSYPAFWRDLAALGRGWKGQMPLDGWPRIFHNNEDNTMSSIYYGQLTVSLFGQSHAPGIGVTVNRPARRRGHRPGGTPGLPQPPGPGAGPLGHHPEGGGPAGDPLRPAGVHLRGRPWRPSFATPTPGRGTMTTSETSPALATPTTPPR